MDLTKIETKMELQRVLMANPKAATESVWALIEEVRGNRKHLEEIGGLIREAQESLAGKK